MSVVKIIWVIYCGVSGAAGASWWLCWQLSGDLSPTLSRSPDHWRHWRHVTTVTRWSELRSWHLGQHWNNYLTLSGQCQVWTQQYCLLWSLHPHCCWSTGCPEFFNFRGFFSVFSWSICIIQMIFDFKIDQKITEPLFLDTLYLVHSLHYVQVWHNLLALCVWADIGVLLK